MKCEGVYIRYEGFDNIYDLDHETAGKLFALATDIARALKEALGCDGMNLVQNNGEIAGQTVFHFHLHLIPRYAGDDVKVGWVPHKSDPDELKSICEAVSARLSSD